MKTIFLVEDDLVLRKNIKEILEANNYSVITALDFKNVLKDFSTSNANLVLMDIELPYLDGNYFCKMIRKISDVPLIFISARNTETDQVFGLELGADDYLVKPFSINILLAKINALLRREINDSPVIKFQSLILDQNTFSLLFKTEQIDLSKVEYRILRKLMQSGEKYVSREELLEEIWDEKTFVDDNTLSVNMTRIKQKIKSVNAPYEIRTKRGIGYILLGSDK